MEEEITMHPKDKLFGATEIWIDGEKITSSNPFGFSIDQPKENEDTVFLNNTFSFEGAVELSEEARRIFYKHEDFYDMVCINIDGLKYTFSDGKDSKIEMEYKELTDEMRKIKVGEVYRIIPDFVNSI